MNTEDKNLVLLEHLDEFRRWPYERLSAQIKAGILSSAGGVFPDGTEYQVEINVFWDGKPGGDIRVIGDLTTNPSLFLIGRPDVVSDFIKRPDGSFVGE